MKKIFLFILLFIILITSVNANHLYKEKDYQVEWCKIHNGKIEYRLNDDTRVDCLTATHAIEFDFARKWAESIGQALYYSIKTGKKAGVVLIMEQPEKEQRYFKRLKTVACKFNITIWTMTPNNLRNY